MNQAAVSDRSLYETYRDELEKATRLLGGTPREDTFRVVVHAGDPSLNPHRVYHTLGHFHDVSNAASVKLLEDVPSFEEDMRRRGLAGVYDEVAAVMVRAGAHHDIVYHVDRDYACAALLRDGVAGIVPPRSLDAPATDYAVTAASPDGNAGLVLEMAKALFDVRPRDILTQFTGKNEFLSAVYAGFQGVRENIPLKYILAEMLLIESTRPFEAHGRFERLRHLLIAANHLLAAASRLDAQEIDAFMLAAVQLSNVDVIGFCQEPRLFLQGSIRLFHETGKKISFPEGYFFLAANRHAFFNNLLARETEGEAAIFHSIAGSPDGSSPYPQRGVLSICEARARANLQRDMMMSEALKVSAALISAVIAVRGEADLAEAEARLRLGRRLVTGGYGALTDATMTETAIILRDYADQYPLFGLASWLLGNISRESLTALDSKVTQQYFAYQERFSAAFGTRKTARELLVWVGEQPGMQMLEATVASALGYRAAEE